MGVLRQQTHAIADVGHPLICVVHHEARPNSAVEGSKAYAIGGWHALCSICAAKDWRATQCRKQP